MPKLLSIIVWPVGLDRPYPCKLLLLSGPSILIFLEIWTKSQASWGFRILGKFLSLDRKGHLFGEGDLFVAGTILKLDGEALEARISATSRTTGTQSWQNFLVTLSCRTAPAAEQ